MKPAPNSVDSSIGPRLVAADRRIPVPNFGVHLDPWHRTFRQNLVDLIWPRRQPALYVSSRPAAFWPDVFVSSHLPWSEFLQSAFCHVAVILALWGSVRLFPVRQAPTASALLNHEDVIYFSPEEYLPPLDTGNAQPQQPQKGDPEYSAQPIISVPPEPDNGRQTIVTPPAVKLNKDVALPNIVAWSGAQPAVPLEATARPLAEARLPVLPVSVVEPTPEVKGSLVRSVSALPQAVVAPSPEIKSTDPVRGMRGPATAVIAPPPSVQTASIHRLGEVNIGHSEAVAPAPALAMAEQRTMGGRMAASLGSGGVKAVPPPPAISAGAASGAGGRIIALGIHPAAMQASVAPPAGNRRGTFAATPGGKAGASGTPDVVARNARGNGTGAGASRRIAGVPSGLMVGAAPGQEGDIGTDGHGRGSNSSVIADVQPPGTGSRQPAEVLENNATEVDRQVFGYRKFYSMTLNMPNLNSAGGSWVIRFAELKQNPDKGDLTAPVATQKVDPAYPIELMRQNVQGTVTLYAVIHSDGSVGAVRVLRGVDDRLDGYARAALARWRFQPATKNGSAVDLETVVMIPFRPVRARAGF